jgi:hypothetical protein
MNRAVRTRQLLELSDLNADGRSLDAQGYYAPRDVTLAGRRLVWTPGELNWRLQRPQPGLLTGFLRLADASDGDVARYAQAHGVLRICRHGIPDSHSAWDVAEAEGPRCRPRAWETTERWRHFSAQANAALRIASALPREPDRVGGRATLRRRATFQTHRADWGVLTPYVVVRMSSTGEATEAGTLALYLTRWLRLGGVEPALSWTAHPRVELFLGSFFGALALQLVLAASGSKGLAFCTECVRPYIPTSRIAQTDKRDHFCETCRELGVPQQRASRRLYERRQRRHAKEAGR